MSGRPPIIPMHCGQVKTLRRHGLYARLNLSSPSRSGRMIRTGCHPWPSPSPPSTGPAGAALWAAFLASRSCRRGRHRFRSKEYEPTSAAKAGLAYLRRCPGYIIDLIPVYGALVRNIDTQHQFMSLCHQVLDHMSHRGRPKPLPNPLSEILPRLPPSCGVSVSFSARVFCTVESLATA